MFDLTVFAHPARLKREFLAITEIKSQSMGPELRREFEQIKQEDPDVLMSSNFWLDFCRTYKKHITLLVAGRAAMTVLVLAAVLASQQILDASNTLTASIGLLVLYSVVQLVMKVINAWTALLQSQLLVCTRTFVTLRMNIKLLRMGQLSSDEFSSGNLKTLISSDIYRIADLFHAIARNGIPCILALIILGPVIVYYMGVPGIIAMAVGFCALPLAFILGKYVHRKEELIKAQEDLLSTIIGEWVTNVRLLRFLGWEKMMQSRVASHVRRLVVESTWQHGAILINFGVSVSWWLIPIIALVISNHLLGGQKNLVALFASIWMLNHITLYIRWLPDIFMSYASAAACVKRLNALFQHREVRDDWLAPCSESLESAKPVRLHFRHVGFKYANDWILKDLNLTLDLNRHTSLIGAVGAGKSTLLKLFCAEMKPTQGNILLEFDNGVTEDLWRENVYGLFRTFIAYMPQEAYLSNTSLAINVALQSHHSNSQVMQAIHMAELEADIGHWEAGLMEEIGETGVNLSGGQKQRVNLARALYSRRSFLVLDDPLSAVDPDTEERLMENLLSGPEGFLLCSHRLSELKKTDRLLVLDKGKIIEDDDPNVLMNDQNSEFSRHLLAGEFEEEEKSHA